MTYYIGLGVSVESTAVCVIDDAGHVVSEFSARSHPEDLAIALEPFADALSGIALEADPLSSFLPGGLKQRGLDSVLMETRRDHASCRPSQLRRIVGTLVVSLSCFGWVGFRQCI
jgi:hypothetical protein